MLEIVPAVHRVLADSEVLEPVTDLVVLAAAEVSVAATRWAVMQVRIGLVVERVRCRRIVAVVVAETAWVTVAFHPAASVPTTHSAVAAVEAPLDRPALVAAAAWVAAE